MSDRRPYLRAQAPRWWAHPPYLGYFMRELTGVGIALYAAILFVGLVCLWRGPDAFAAYQRALASPISLLVHLLLLVVMLYHVVTWFQILPKTMPKLILSGRVVPQARISAVTLAIALGCSLVLLIAVMVVGVVS